MSRRPKRPRNNQDCVTVDVCLARHEALSKDVTALYNEAKDIKRALVGEDLSSGLVGEIKSIKAKLNMASELRDWVRPLFIAIATALITAAAFKILHL